ncbi:twin-arginine translocase TatA/TatE family subunit [Prauserella shujinwangii]
MGMSGFAPSHLLILLLVVIVLFGARRLPDAARGIGRSLKVFKAELADRGSAPAPPERLAAEPVADADTLAAQWRRDGTPEKAPESPGASSARGE